MNNHHFEGNSDFGAYEYIAHVWDEIDEVEEERRGVTMACTLIEAMQNIYDYYGDEIIDVKIAPLEPMSCYEFEDDNGVLFDPSGVTERE